MILPFSVTVLSLVSLYFAAKQSKHNEVALSPQGCRMSWMSPSYILQNEFDELWTPLSRRYSLWLYREVEWDTASKVSGNPVLFIPGHAGSSHQARSIASSAARQFHASPGVVHPDFEGKRPADVFTVEFNEDFSALHGPTLKTQAEYVAEAINYVLSLYPRRRRSITLIGHSMGGIVARLALADAYSGQFAREWNISDVSAVITLSAPNSLPVARLDSTMESVYRTIAHFDSSMTSSPPLHVPPVLSLCGGSTDLQIPSEMCRLPSPTSAEAASSNAVPYRRTLYTTSMSGVWSGVGHQEMVWCHQVRWKVARAALDLGNVENQVSKTGTVLDRWFPPSEYSSNPSIDAPVISSPPAPPLDPSKIQFSLANSATLRVSKISSSPGYHVLPIPARSIETDERILSLLLAGGTPSAPSLPPGLAPHHVGSVRLTLYRCTSTTSSPSSSPEDAFRSSSCLSLDDPRARQTVGWQWASLLPLPSKSDVAFPGKEGIDESSGLLSLSLSLLDTGARNEWIVIRSEGGSGGGKDGEWFAAGFDQTRTEDLSVGVLGLALGTASVSLDHVPFVPFSTILRVPMSASALLVHRIRITRRGSCKGDFLRAPIIRFIPPRRSVDDSESQIFIPLSFTTATTSPSSNSQIEEYLLVSSHSTGPFFSPLAADTLASIEITTSGTCGVQDVSVTVDWTATFGRFLPRFWIVLPIYVVGVAAFVSARAFREVDVREKDFPDPTLALIRASSRDLPLLALSLSAISILPLPRYALLGTNGEVALAWIPLACVFFATGLLWIQWVFILGVVKVLGWARRLSSSQPSEPYSLQTKLISSTLLALLSLFIFPVQLVYLIVLLRQFWRCSEAGLMTKVKSRMSPPPGTFEISAPGRKWKVAAPFSLGAVSYNGPTTTIHAQRLHILLFLWVLFPLVGPVLLVWARTLATAGLFAPFPGDHNILKIISILCIAECTDLELPRPKGLFSKHMVWVPLAVVSLFAFTLGPRFSYGVLMMANAMAGVMLSRVLITQTFASSK